MTNVDELRDELKRLGYLSHGIERWFALDPWSSRTFWAELFLLATKSASLGSVFVALPLIAIMAGRNHPLGLTETAVLSFLYIAAAFATLFGLVVLAALIIKVRPSLPVESQRFLNIFATTLSAVIAFGQWRWWLGFPGRFSLVELAGAAALVLLGFFVTMSVFAAALLSLSIHESHRIPTTHSRSRSASLLVASIIVLVLVILVPLTSAGPSEEPVAPLQVVTTPANRRVAFLAVDGLSQSIFAARPALSGLFSDRVRVPRFLAESAPEGWATVGTGTLPALHRVRAVEAVTLAGGSHVLQSVSSRDFILRDVAVKAGLARRVPLPPTARQRSYVWEIVAARGVPSMAVNWWTTESMREGPLWSVSQEEIFSSSKRPGESPLELARSIDHRALEVTLEGAETVHPRLVSVYLPALDVILNRLQADPSAKLATSAPLLDELEQSVERLRGMGYEVLLVGAPGAGQEGEGIIAATFPLAASPGSSLSVAPTLLDLLGFPVSEEMPGRSLLPGSAQPRISSYGSAGRRNESQRVDADYYESLRSLGYIH